MLSGTPTNAGTFNFTVQVTDNAGASTNKAFTLDINPPSRIDQVGLNGNQIRLQFTAQPGQPYALEFRASLATGNWEALTNIDAQPITVDVTFTDSITENGRFYRLKNIAR